MSFSTSTQLPAPKARHFLPADFAVTTAESVQPYLQQLLDRPIHSVEDLIQLLRDDDELGRAMGEQHRRVNIRLTCDTTDEAAKADFQRLVVDFVPLMEQFSFDFGNKVLDSPFVEQLDQHKYFVLLRAWRQEMELHRAENVPLFVESAQLQKEYGAITGAMTVTIDGEEKTLQQAGKYLFDTDRTCANK